MLTVLVAVLAVCGVAMADWAADYAAWKALPAATRCIDSAQRDQAVLLISTAISPALDTMAADNLAVVQNEQNELRVRGWTSDIVAMCYERQISLAVTAGARDAALAAWSSLNQFCDRYKTPPFDNWIMSGVWGINVSGPVLVKAGYINQAALDANLAERVALVPMNLRIIYWEMLPTSARPTPADVLAFARANAKFAEILSPTFTYLSDAYTNKAITAKDYNDALKVVINASIDRMNNMATDDPAFAALQKAIRGFKTSFENLQFTEKGNL